MSLYQVTFKKESGEQLKIFIEALGICPAITEACGRLFSELGLEAADYEPIKAVKVKRTVQK